MQFKKNIVDTALLGTAKKQLQAGDLPEALLPYLDETVTGAVAAEEQFLKATSLAIAYYRSGVRPVSIEIADDEAPAEHKAYCAPKAAAQLKNLLAEKYTNLVWYWMLQCSQKGQLITPDLLPAMFNMSLAGNKHTAALFVTIAGNRAQWLTKFNPHWKVQKPEEENFDWDTAALAHRCSWLEKLRLTNPAEAVEKIQGVWKEENAAARLELFSTLAVNLNLSDEPFITAMLNDKSKQVKEKAMQFLKAMPGSQVLNKYTNILRNSVKLKENKILGLISRNSLEVKLQGEDESLFATGIDKLSAVKGVSDEDYILAQLVSEVPPAFWSEHFGMNINETVKQFAEKNELKKFQANLGQSVIKFGEKKWAAEILEHFKNPDIDLLGLLDNSMQVKYAQAFVKVDVDKVIDVLRTTPVTEWSLNLAFDIVNETAQNPHRYNKAFYESICLWLPASLTPMLDKVPLAEEWKINMWQNNKAEIEKLIHLKEEIKNNN